MEEVAEGRDYSFPREEERILALWKELDAFHTQLKRTEGMPEYVFYDGPPFATGLPHYGHILAGTIKDIVTRYQSATGHHVTRRFGWDCHGLPVEYEIDQLNNIKTREDVLAMGIDVYNEKCRSIVMRYSAEWERTVTRTGRWIDFADDYKTLNPSYMESIWWVFSQLHKKGLVYKGFKVMPYSTACVTPLSNFEAGLNYKDVADPAVMVTFPLLERDGGDGSGGGSGGALVAWTTTPWTLPSNLALCVNATFMYVKVQSKETGDVLIVAESRASFLPGKKKGVGGKADLAEPDGAAGSGKKEHGKGKKEKGSSMKSAAGAAAHEAAKGVASNGKPAVDESTYTVLGRMSGADLVGRQYRPLFPYFEEEMKDVAFRVLADPYVTDDSGTGVVHMAPAFGEDDYRVCLQAGIVQKGDGLPNPVDQSGRFTERVSDFAGRYVKEADRDIIAHVKAAGRLISAGSIMHSYPFCWRSDTPLLYKAVPSWFVAVEVIKERLLVANAGTYWVPGYVKEKRFHNWLEGARDWAISRSRFWGTPLPIWVSDDGHEMVVVGSVDELEQLSGFRATDLHRHFIDHVTIPSKEGRGDLKRIPEVFDCWFESGSMPYAYIHYPFENRELFERNFPGNFVAEGLDQTRGWFYTLMVLAVALFDKPAFQNLICNGLVLAEDGKKMSKRLKNYPDPNALIDEYGADALRLYLINSPVVRAESLRFKKEGVFAVVKDVFLPWYNAFRFLVQNARRLAAEGLPPFQPPAGLAQLQGGGAGGGNVLDRWIKSATQTLTLFVRAEMEAYRLYTVVPRLVKFIDLLTNVYVRLNRERLKGKTGEADCRTALATLFQVLLTVCKVMAPFTPFFTETMFQTLRKVLPGAEESIHYCTFPVAEGEMDPRIEQSVARMMTVVDLARNIRERHARPLKMPLKEMVVVHADTDFLEDITGTLREYVSKELNVRSVVPCNDRLQYALLRAEPEFSTLGQRLGKAMGPVAKEVKAMDTAAITAYQQRGQVEVAGHVLGPGDIKIVTEFRAPDGTKPSTMDAATDGDVLVVLSLEDDEELRSEGLAREIVNRVQKLRKEAGLEPTDEVDVFIGTAGAPGGGEGGGAAAAESQLSGALQHVVTTQAEFIKDKLGCPLLPLAKRRPGAVVLKSGEFAIDSREAEAKEEGDEQRLFTLCLCKPTLCFDVELLAATCGGDEEAADDVAVALLARDPARLKSELLASGGKADVAIDGRGRYKLELGHHFHLSVGSYEARNMRHGI